MSEAFTLEDGVFSFWKREVLVEALCSSHGV